MRPANERLDPRHHVRLRLDDGLVAQLHFAARQRVSQILFEHTALFGRLMQVARIESETAAPVALCRIKREIGVADEVIAALSVEGRDRDADRGADDAAAALDRIGLRQAGDDVGRQLAQFAAILDIGEDDLEFVAAKPADHFAVADDLEQSFGDLFQQRVARRMAECVVDLLEPVEVDQHDRARALLLRERGQGGVELFRDVEAVGETRQRVIEREPRRVFGRAALFGDVGAASPITREFAPSVELRPARDRPPAIVAFERAAQRQFMEFRLFGQQEGQGALAFALAVDGKEQIGEGGAEQRAAGSSHQPRHRIGDIGQPPLGIGRPEPALAAFFVIAEQQERVVRVQIRRGLAALFADAGAELTEKASLGFVGILLSPVAGIDPRWHVHPTNSLSDPHCPAAMRGNRLR